MSPALPRTFVCATVLLWAGISSSSVARVVVNEIHYRPARAAVTAGDDATRLRFVELYNAGNTRVDLSGWSLASAVRVIFPEGTAIAPGDYLVVAADPWFLRDHEPSMPAGAEVLRWDGFDEARGGVQLLDSRGIVDEMRWTGEGARPSPAAGWGHSLELVNPRLNVRSERAWRPSTVPNGTPGAENSVLGEPIVVSEFPARGRSAPGLHEIAVTFSENMKHVAASDLTVNGVPASRVSGSGAGPYVFAVSAAGGGTISVTLRGNGLATEDGRTFEGDSWQYVAFAPAVLSMPDGANGGVGATVQVPISVTPGDGIFGIDMSIQYNAAILQAQDVTVSGIAATAGFALVRNLNTPGTIIISTYATQNALVGSGEIARIHFLVLGAPGTASNLTFNSASINEGGIPASLDPGLFTVTCAASANGTACNDGNPCTANDTCQSGACTGGTPLQIPAEVSNLRLGADHVTLTWNSAIAAGPGTVHDVIRGLVTQLPVGTGPAEICFAQGIAAATAADASVPAASTSYWYLVRGRNACGTGTYGFRGVNGSPGPERVSATCP
jgi:hypothetical protein